VAPFVIVAAFGWKKRRGRAGYAMNDFLSSNLCD
jgi:hypothetical protein